MVSQDLRSAYDYLVGILICLACIPYIIGIIVIVVNRDYPPIKIRNVALTVMSSLGGLVWVSATIVVNNHFGRKKDTFWTICSLWTFWLQACFGCALWVNCMTINLVHLYCLLILKKRIKKQHNLMWIITPLLLLLSPVIITSIFASVLHACRFVPNAHQSQSGSRPEGDCKICDNKFIIIILVILPAYFLLFIGLSYKLRRFMAQYNSFRQIRNGGIMSLFVFLLSLVTLQTHSYKRVAGRCFLSLSVALVVFYYFWARNGEIIYNVLFNKEDYCQRFRQDIHRSWDDSRSNPPVEIMSMEALLFERREQANLYLLQVKELQINLSNLRQTYEELEKQVSKPRSLEIRPGPE
ncbi:hypothetical protein O6H91_06G051200 [Diphasiastrum complanatum]|uniref:Uncharacterized protein n=2 Tax=Diphasiastrum complanatum TaxID=34168 RepID=A0ACC2DDE5_DIPCM|nr:hypothetical protein O6H91_06G051200 [Diphasiastrum complanatum]KAJ7552344.1 hypothetical protein O6H91_06G051200 [Diphasiastrum complanatum]